MHGRTEARHALTRHLAAIANVHSAAGYDSPASLRNAAVKEVLAGIRRTKGTAPACKAPLLVGSSRPRYVILAKACSAFGIRLCCWLALPVRFGGRTGFA